MFVDPAPQPNTAAAEYYQVDKRNLISSLFQELNSLVGHPSNPYSHKARNEMLQILSELEKNGYYVREGSDDFRAPFVGLQGVIEHLLAIQKTTKKISHILGAIHAPTPPTPLCAKVDGENVKNLMDPEVIKNQDKLATVTERAVTIRRLLERGATLFAIYPEGGMEKRKEEEQQIFLGVWKNYPEHLKTIQITSKEMDLIGAIYIFTDETGKTFVFSIKAQQANKPLEKSIWGIWFGTMDHPEVNKRFEEVSDYLKKHGNLNILDEFLKIAK